jgi:hypothetical protein
MEYTLTYSDGANGWPSFYSFIPDWMIGMNNYFYTFKGGNLYRHNVNNQRNTFYIDWWTIVSEPSDAFTPSRVTSVFNDVPLQNKLFKTLNIEGDDAWAATLETDIQNSGFIEKGWFEKKEQSYFAFVRNSGTVPAGTDEYALRSLNGVGRSSSVVGPSSATEINFSINPLIAIGNIASIGDYLYYSLPPTYSTPVLCGQITNIVQNYPAGDNYFIVDTTIPGGIAPPIPDAYFLYIKNSVAESHGVLGHYCLFNIENDNKAKVELFAVESEVMKSYP